MKRKGSERDVEVMTEGNRGKNWKQKQKRGSRFSICSFSIPLVMHMLAVYTICVGVDGTSHANYLKMYRRLRHKYICMCYKLFIFLGGSPLCRAEFMRSSEG